MTGKDRSPVVQDGVWHDLTHPVVSGMPVYPGDPPVWVEPALTIAEDTVNVLRMHLGSQSGTHVDAPAHIDDSLPTLDQLPLSRFAGPVVLVPALGQAPGRPFGTAVLDPVRERLRPGVVVFLVTGWSRFWGTDAYWDHPWPSPELAAQLVAAGVRTVGIDTASVDVTQVPTVPEPPVPEPPATQVPAATDGPLLPEPGPDSTADGLRTHRVLAAASCVIVENLTGLEPLLAAQDRGARIEASLFPLRLIAADGAPIRAVAAEFPAPVPAPSERPFDDGAGRP